MRTPKKAKCNIHSLSFCNNKHDAPQCTECILVKHRDRKYIYKDGQMKKQNIFLVLQNHMYHHNQKHIMLNGV